MTTRTNDLQDGNRKTAFLAIFCVLLISIRVLFPERGYDDLGWRAWVDSVFAIGFLALILLLAASAGIKILRGLQIKGFDDAGWLVMGSGIGLGIMAYGVMILGLAGVLFPYAILGWLLLLAWICRAEMTGIAGKLPRLMSERWVGYQAWDYAKKGLVLIISIIFGLNVLQALTPPWGYDALMYHLQAPHIFLEQGRISILPDVWQANGPLTIEMLYTIGLSVGSDVFARLIHLTFLGLFFAGTFALGRRLLGETGGWLSLAIMAGIPILPLWGNLAYSDMALALFSLMTFYSLALWREGSNGSYLWAAALSMGFALGSKYTAIGMLVVVGIWIAVKSMNGGWKEATWNAGRFVGPAMLIASPWYIKNWAMAGNPVYPFYFGGPGWDAARLEAINYYLVEAFGTGRRFLDYILLPYNLYAQHGEFGTSFSTIDFPSFLFPLILFYPLARRRIKLDDILLLTAVLFGLWAVGSQQTRFLIPVYPLLCVLTSLSLIWLGEKIKSAMIQRAMAVGFVGGFVVVSLIYQISHQVGVFPFPVISGTESKSDFLTRAVYDYRTVQFIRKNIGADERVLMMWDGQGYYCDQRCLPDADQTRAWRLMQMGLSPHDLAAKLIEAGSSYILIDLEGLSFFTHYDVDGRHQLARDYFFDQFVPQCGEEVFRDVKVLLYKIVCDDGKDPNE